MAPVSGKDFATCVVVVVVVVVIVVVAAAAVVAVVAVVVVVVVAVAVAGVVVVDVVVCSPGKGEGWVCCVVCLPIASARARGVLRARDALRPTLV